MKRPILLTGFKPFAGHPANPSELVARALNARSIGGYRIRAASLPVVYTTIERDIERLIESAKPAAVVSLGLDYRTDFIKLERIAINVDDATVPDEAGEVRQGTRISSRGPAARWSGLPLDGIAGALARADVSFVYSTHAGAYLCNHLMYHLCGCAERAGIPAGFVHLPPTPELIKENERGRRRGTPLETLIDSTRAVLGAVAASLGKA